MALVAALPERAVRRAQMTRAERLDAVGKAARPEVLPPLACFIKYRAAGGIVEFGPGSAAGEEEMAAARAGLRATL